MHLASKSAQFDKREELLQEARYSSQERKPEKIFIEIKSKNKRYGLEERYCATKKFVVERDDGRAHPEEHEELSEVRTTLAFVKNGADNHAE